MSNSYRHSASFGKRQEYRAIAELLKKGYDVYMTLVDDQGIDCIVRQSINKYFDVQIKASVLSAKYLYCFVIPSEARNLVVRLL